jgi:hypothetical protein
VGGHAPAGSGSDGECRRLNPTTYRLPGSRLPWARERILRVRRAIAVVVSAFLLAACSGESTTSTTYDWTPTAAESAAVGAARNLDSEAVGVWETYSDGLVLHYIYDFCAGLEAAGDVLAYLNERAESQGEAVMLPLVVGSPYLCPERSTAVGNWIATRAAEEGGEQGG